MTGLVSVGILMCLPSTTTATLRTVRIDLAIVRHLGERGLVVGHAEVVDGVGEVQGEDVVGDARADELVAGGTYDEYPWLRSSSVGPSTRVLNSTSGEIWLTFRFTHCTSPSLAKQICASFESPPPVTVVVGFCDGERTAGRRSRSIARGSRSVGSEHADAASTAARRRPARAAGETS